MGRLNDTSGGGRLGGGKADDLGTVEGLSRYAARQGFAPEVAKITEQPKLSFLQRLSSGLGALNPAEAVLTGKEKGVGAGILEYQKNVLSGIGSAITGTDYQPERRYFSDVAKELGVENGILKFGIGFFGDVLLDPSTYFGGVIARGVTAGTKFTTSTALKGIGKVAPETEAGLRMAGEGLKDALGRAFQYGYKASKGATEDVLTFLSKEQRAKLGIAASNLNRLGTGVLTASQREELALKMIAGKRAEFVARNATADQFMAIGKDLPEELQDRVLEFSFLKEALLNDPARKLSKYVNKKTGLIPEVLGKGKSKFARKGDDIVDELGFPDSETARAAYDPYLLRKEKAERLAAEIRAEKKYFKDAKVVDELTAITEADIMRLDSARIGRETALEGTSPAVATKIEQQIARSKKFAEGVTTNPYESYFPFIRREKLEKFLNETTGIRVGSEGYRKQFRNLLTNENLELDPAKAFFTREAQIVSDRITRDFLAGFVKKYGKPLTAFKSADEASRAGYRLIKEKGNFGRDLGYVPEFDAKLIRDSISPEFQTINMIAKATGFDALTSLFKRSVTGLFLPFHVRNFASGIIQNYEVLGPAALNPKTIASAQKMAFIMGRGDKIPKQLEGIMKPFVARFSGDTFYNNDFLYALDQGAQLRQAQSIRTAEGLKSAARSTLGFQKGNVLPVLGQDSIPFRVARAVGQFVEHHQKATAYLVALEKGMNTTEALRMAERAGFDYRALTRFESQIMRRLIPFYSFTRKNIELQLRTLGSNPQRVNQVLAFFKNVGPAFGGESLTPEEKRVLPDFIRESIGVKLQDTPEGLKQYIANFGTPIEAFTQLFASNPVLRQISQMNPILKVPIEIGIGKDSFRQRDLKDVYDAREYKLAPQIVKDLLGLREVQKDILKRTVSGKLIKVGTRTQYVADPERLLIARSLFTSRGVSYLDQLFGGDLKGFVQFIKTTTGVKPQQVDIQMYEAIKEKEQKEEITDLLLRTGKVRQFKTIYEP